MQVQQLQDFENHLFIQYNLPRNGQTDRLGLIFASIWGLTTEMMCAHAFNPRAVMFNRFSVIVLPLNGWTFPCMFNELMQKIARIASFSIALLLGISTYVLLNLFLFRSH